MVLGVRVAARGCRTGPRKSANRVYSLCALSPFPPPADHRKPADGRDRDSVTTTYGRSSPPPPPQPSPTNIDRSAVWWQRPVTDPVRPYWFTLTTIIGPRRSSSSSYPLPPPPHSSPPHRRHVAR